MNHVTRTAGRRSLLSSRPWHKTVTSSNHLVSTLVEQDFGVPLTIADVHLRNEQLPFAYFFPQTLCQDQLLVSLSTILPNFPVLGGAVTDVRCLSIQCKTTDSIPCTFATSDQSLEYWLAQRNILRRRKSPDLLPLFDPLVSLEENLATIKITTLQDGSTVIGMTVNHMVADAASCFHFLSCWGNHMHDVSSIRSIQHQHNRLSNDRSLVTCSGMMTHQTADVMGLVTPETSWTDDLWSIMRLVDNDETPKQETTNNDDDSDHAYVHLAFPAAVLVAMKAHGMSHSRTPHETHGDIDFVSINDMMTAFGWLLKRELSGQADSNVAMVVNLRGRCGVDTISDNGLFGNGITNFTADIPEQATNEEETDQQISIDGISIAALAIRSSLMEETRDTPDRLTRSRLGIPPRAASTPTSPCFSTTAWGAFPIWDIQFGTGAKLVGFHGQPSHPMPPGDMFASIIVPNGAEDGFTYQLLAPKDKENQARTIHARLCGLFIAWHVERIEQEAKLHP